MHSLKELSPGDPQFRSVMSYRTYPLRNTEGGRGSGVAYNTGVNTRRVDQVMGSHIFDGNDPIAALAFLKPFKKQMDKSKLSERAACRIDVFSWAVMLRKSMKTTSNFPRKSLVLILARTCTVPTEVLCKGQTH